MKTIWLALHNIKKIYKKHLAVFLLIIISMTVSTFGMLFYSGYIGQKCIEREKGDGDYIKFTLSEDLSSERLIELLDYVKTEYEQVSHVKIYDSQDLEDYGASGVLGTESMEMSSEINISVVGEYYKQFENRILLGRNLSYEENEAVALISSDYAPYLEYEDIPVNATISLEKCDLDVVGMVSYFDEEAIVVPIKYYIENFRAKEMEIGFEERLSESVRDQVDAKISEYDIYEEYNWTLAKPILKTWDFWIEFVQILMIFVVIIINIFVIIYFLQFRMKQTYSIYSICGGEKTRIFFVIILQAFIIVSIGNIIGSAVYMIFMSLIKSLNMVYHESIVFYIGIVAVIEVISLIVTIITGIKVNRKITVYRTLE